ncbi:hypothetical protein BpHYR1_035262 [Brachionus plicatilis]|uniref:Uncharacterized protein n=1 Tax=Brachionus plicatilis TaxID=10195 RepID=A0A3M7RGU6_BRAPC|nr:hypothetical protein BpHYR1_035262 [Brachionus plicatilis]
MQVGGGEVVRSNESTPSKVNWLGTPDNHWQSVRPQQSSSTPGFRFIRTATTPTSAGQVQRAGPNGCTGRASSNPNNQTVNASSLKVYRFNPVKTIQPRQGADPTNPAISFKVCLFEVVELFRICLINGQINMLAPCGTNNYVLNYMTTYDIEPRANSLDIVLYNLWVHIAQASANFVFELLKIYGLPITLINFSFQISPTIFDWSCFCKFFLSLKPTRNRIFLYPRLDQLDFKFCKLTNLLCHFLFYTQWINLRSEWFEGAQLFVPSTNNALEASNKPVPTVSN